MDFTSGNTAIRMAFSPNNVAYFVWREDHGHQALLRCHQTRAEAQVDFTRRVAFLPEVLELQTVKEARA